MKLLKRTWANVSIDALEHNCKAIRRHAGNCKMMGVVKADAYGHGAVPVSHALTELGTEYLAVSNLEEAVQIRRGGVRTPILILGYTPAEYAENMVYLDISQEVHSLEYAHQLSRALDGTNFMLTVHLKIDTGMSRIGFLTEHMQELLEAAHLPHLHVEGVFTHFSVADSRSPEDEAYTRRQYQLFQQTVEALKSVGVEPELTHCCNSGATLLYPEYAMDMVRPGIMTYGIHPSTETEGILSLEPVMSLSSTVSQIRTLPAGTEISYGRTHRTEDERRVAVISVGYADGLLRSLSGRMGFLIHGAFAPQVGRICMDMCMADVTDIPGVQAGDEVVIIGASGGLSQGAEHLSRLLDTIPYEVLCGINKRIPRIYIQNGKASEILQYIV